MEILNKIASQLKHFWNNLTMVQRFTFIFLALFLILGAIFLGSVLFTADYTELASNLDPDDAGAMVEILEEEGVSYSLEDDGRTIKVPGDEHSRIRLKMAESGLPRHGAFGYEELDETPLGLTESERRLRQKVALEGELVRTIRMYPEVEDARVHIAAPEETIFNRQERDVTAAVHLHLARGKELSSEQVESIMNLVAHSVENLSREEVVITSGSRILSDEIEKIDRVDARDEVRQQLEIQSEFQETLQKNVQSMLEQVLGMGNVIVRVNAELDFDEVQTAAELFEPVEDGEGILVSMHEVTEFFEGTGPVPGGVVGDPAVDTPEYPAEKEKEESLYERTEETRNYEVDRIEEEHKQASGDVESISVAVAVDGELEEELNEEQEDAIRSLVVDALGLQVDGRDEVTVEQMPFDRTMEEDWAEERERAAALERRQQIIQAAMWIIGLLVAFFVGRRLYRGYMERKEEERLRQQQAAQQEVEQQPQEVPEESEAKKQIADLAQKQPEEFAKILRAWLGEE